jgi:hypothetical protein
VVISAKAVSISDAVLALCTTSWRPNTSDLQTAAREVLADRDERRMLVVQPHAHLAVWALRNLGNRRGDVGVHLLAGHDAQPRQEHPRDADHAVLALAL